MVHIQRAEANLSDVFGPRRDVDLGLVQMSMGPAMDLNLEKAISLVREAADQGAKIICLPELFRSPYFPREEHCPIDYSEPIGGPTYRALSQVAKEKEIVLIGGSTYQRTPDGKGYNTAAVFGTDGKLLGEYQKMHIPHDPGFFEKDHFNPGKLGFVTFDTPYAKIAVQICFDQWFAKAAEAVARKGAEILFYPTAIGTVSSVEQIEGSWQERWEAVQRGHAISNNMVVAAVNRVGDEGDTHFFGGSFIYDGFGGKVIGGMPVAGQPGVADDSEQLLIAKLNLAHSTFVRQAWGFGSSALPDAVYDE